MPTTKVIDLTSDNIIPDNLKAARAAGVVGMIHRCTEGEDGVDDKAKARVFLAKEAGMLVGLYHILDDAKVKDQVDNFVTAAKELGLEDNWLLAVDYDPEGAELEVVSEFMDCLEKETRRDPVLRAGAIFKAKVKHGDKQLANKRLWLQQYETAAEAPAGFDKFWLWQYTDAGEVSGVQGDIGCSDHAGSDELLAREWSGFKGRHDSSLPAAPAEPAQQPSEPGEPESGTAPAEQPPTATQTPANPAEPSNPGEPESGTAPAEGPGSAPTPYKVIK